MRAREIEQQKKEPVLTAMQYIHALRTVDFEDADSMDGFLKLTQIRDHQPPAQPILLGVDNGFKYFLVPKLPFFHINNHNARLAEEDGHPVLIKFRSITDQPLANSIVLGMHLGLLEAGRIDDQYTQSTPFNVFVNVANRSLWIVLDREPIDSYGNRTRMAKSENPRSCLPSPQGDRPQFDALEIMKWGELKVLSNSEVDPHRAGEPSARRFFSTEVISGAKMLFLEPYTPTKMDYFSIFTSATGFS